MNAARLYPGMCDDAIEFFFHEGKQKMMVLKSGKTQCFDELDYSVYQILDQIIDSDKKLQKTLQSWFPEDRHAQRKELAKCRFGGLNHIPDISACRTKISHDHIKCPLRGKCSGEGNVCKKIQYEGEEITNQEIQLLQLLGTEKKNHEIAAMLSVPLGTFNVFKTNMYEKLQIHNKQDVTRISGHLGI